MAIDIDKTFSRGGKELIDLLDHGVRAFQTDLLFVFLAQEFRQHPTTPKAVALYDIFCTLQSPARLSATEMLPPINLQIEAALRPLKSNLAQRHRAQTGAVPGPPLILPPKFLFDGIVQHLRENSSGLRSVRRRYQIKKTPLANLPGGKMTEGQRHFVEKIWEPDLRPRLVAAGFRRLASIA